MSISNQAWEVMQSEVVESKVVEDQASRCEAVESEVVEGEAWKDLEALEGRSLERRRKLKGEFS